MHTKPEQEANTEEKIKKAARRIFIEKGYAATRTRDIAKAAEINLSMLNYYFRSKENLFELVMIESFSSFIATLKDVLDDKTTSLNEKITRFASDYIDLLMEEPGLYIFLVNEIRQNPGLQSRLTIGQSIRETYFMKQLSEAMARNPLLARMDPRQLIMNIYAMTLFPFATNHMLQATGNELVNFSQLLQERKTLIPRWVAAMLAMSE